MYHYLREHYGDIASVFGLLVTFFGFWVTIRRVHHAERAAQEARAAAEEARRLSEEIVARLHVAEELSTPVECLRGLETACRDRKWSTALVRCDEARGQLIRLCAQPRLNDQERTEVEQAVNFMGELLMYLPKFEADATRRISDKRTRQLHEIIVKLGEAHGRLRLGNEES